MGLKSSSKSGKGGKSGSKSGKGGKSNGKLNSGRFQQLNTQNDSGSEEEPQIDSSVLRPSIEVSVKDFTDLVKMFNGGTAEIKNLLAHQCYHIYVCKVCKNLFRSVATFVSHKRVSCRKEYCATAHTRNRTDVVEDYTRVIQPEPAPAGSPEARDGMTSDDSAAVVDVPSAHINTAIPPISTYSKPKKDLSKIVEKLGKKSSIQTVTETVGHLSATHFIEDINQTMIARNNDRKKNAFQLESMEATKIGVFQTKLCTTTTTTSTIQAENTDLTKAQISELLNIESDDEATLGPNGQIVMVNGHSSWTVASDKDTVSSEQTDAVPGLGNAKEEHVCQQCNQKFSTRKTLSHHVKSLHAMFHMCYPCPCCKSIFVNTWSVYRHLYKVHRKTIAQVRKLRPQIQEKAFRKDKSEVLLSPAPGNIKNATLKELPRLVLNQDWMLNFEDDLELQRCGRCGRRFGRRGALNSHTQICQKRIAPRNNVKSHRGPASMSSGATAVDKVTKQSLAPQSESEPVDIILENTGLAGCVVEKPSSSDCKVVLEPNVVLEATQPEDSLLPCPNGNVTEEVLSNGLQTCVNKPEEQGDGVAVFIQEQISLPSTSVGVKSDSVDLNEDKKRSASHLEALSNGELREDGEGKAIGGDKLGNEDICPVTDETYVLRRNEMDLTSRQNDPSALQKMVMEVIFGSSSDANPDFNQTLFSDLSNDGEGKAIGGDKLGNEDICPVTDETYVLRHNERDLTSRQNDPSALQKMVMEVIFGSSSDANPDFNQTLFSDLSNDGEGKAIGGDKLGNEDICPVTDETYVLRRNERDLISRQNDPSALQKMVMEVIFGSSSEANPHFNQTLFSDLSNDGEGKAIGGDKLGNEDICPVTDETYVLRCNEMDLTSRQNDPSALQKMVMEVIFGSSSDANPDFNQTLFSDLSNDGEGKAIGGDKLGNEDICPVTDETYVLRRNERDLTSRQNDPSALQKMVMEVIFGSSSDANPDFNQTLFSDLSNGVYRDDLSSRASSAASELQMLLERNCDSPASMGMSTSPSEYLSTVRSTKSTNILPVKPEVPPVESTRRERPVRNRVRVAREDFIYDLSDACLNLKKEPIIR